MTNKTSRHAFRAVDIPSPRYLGGGADEYRQMILAMLEGTEVGKFTNIVGPMYPQEIGPALNIYEDQADDVHDVVQEYIDVTGSAIDRFAKVMADADRELVARLNSIV